MESGPANIQRAIGRLRTFSFVTGSTNGDTSCFIKARSVRSLVSRFAPWAERMRSHLVERKEDLRDVDADGLAQSFAIISLQDLEPGSDALIVRKQIRKNPMPAADKLCSGASQQRAAARRRTLSGPARAWSVVRCSFAPRQNRYRGRASRSRGPSLVRGRSCAARPDGFVSDQRGRVTRRAQERRGLEESPRGTRRRKRFV